MTRPRPPADLSPAARKWWRKLLDDFRIEDAHGLALAEQAARMLDRIAQAREAIQTHGVTVRDRHGQVRANPATAVERDAMAAFRGAIRELHLDDLPPEPGPGRPAGR